MSETGIEIVPLFGMFLRQKTFLEKIDEIINRDMIGCEGCDECLEDLCYSCFGCKPELWKEYILNRNFLEDTYADDCLWRCRKQHL